MADGNSYDSNGQPKKKKKSLMEKLFQRPGDMAVTGKAASKEVIEFKETFRGKRRKAQRRPKPAPEQDED